MGLLVNVAIGASVLGLLVAGVLAIVWLYKEGAFDSRGGF